MEKKYVSIILKIASLFLALVCLFLLTSLSLKYLYPFIIGMFIAFSLNPAVSFIEKRLGFSRLTATLAVTLISICLFFTFLIFIISELVQGIVFLLEFLPKHILDFVLLVKAFFLEHIKSFYQKFLSINETDPLFNGSFFYQFIDQLHEMLGNAIANLLKEVLSSLHDFIIKIPESLVIILFIAIISIVITYEYDHFLRVIEEKLPERFLRKISKLISELKSLLKKYVKALFFLSGITFLITYLGLLIIDIQASFTIALLIAFIDFLPILGPSLIFIPWIIYLFISKNYLLTIKLALLFMFLIIIRQAIEPKLLSNVFQVPFIYVLLIMFLTYKIAGLAGIVLTPFLIIIILALKRVNFYNFLLKFFQS